ncbi:MAG: hypothetical protein ABSD30_08275 [Candidatus Binatus sp.]
MQPLEQAECFDRVVLNNEYNQVSAAIAQGSGDCRLRVGGLVQEFDTLAKNLMEPRFESRAASLD